MVGIAAVHVTGLVAIQVDGAAIGALERVAAMQTVIAAVMVIFGLIAIGGAAIAILELRAARKLLHNLGDTMDDLKPRLAPLIDRATSVTDDVSVIVDNVRHKVDDVLFTVEEVNRAVRRAASATEERVQRFGAVLDVVQSEAEELLLDATATARGVHETARQLRGDGEPRRRRGPRRPTVEFEDEEFEDEEFEDAEFEG